MTAIVDHGPTVISLPGDIASAARAETYVPQVSIAAPPVFRPADADLDKLAEMIDAAENGGDFRRRRLPRCAGRGAATCGQTEGAGRILVSRQAMAGARQSQCRRDDRADRLRRSVQGHSRCGLVLLLGTDFPFSEFLPGDDVHKGADRQKRETHRPANGRRFALVGDIKATVAALLPKIRDKSDSRFLDKSRRRNQLVPRASAALRCEGAGDQADPS